MFGPTHLPREQTMSDRRCARLLLSLMARTLTCLALGAGVSIPSSMAQGNGAAADLSQHQFDVPAGALDQVLGRFGRQAQVLISVNAELTAGLGSPGVSGRHSVAEALRLLLTGTGLEAVTQTDGGYSLRKAAPTQTAPAPQSSRSVQLAGVTVTGQALRLGQPANRSGGYVASDSPMATKTGTAIIDTPQSISVVTQQQLEEQGVQSVSEALRYMPGVLAEQYGGVDTRTDNYAVRGFADSFPYLDGLSTLTYFSLLSPVVEPYGLERVEVLRGPPSVLNGQAGSPGGLISLVSKRPTAQSLRELALETGSYGRIQGNFDFSGPVDGNSQLLYRFTGLARDTGTQTDFQRDRRYYFAPALTWKPGPDTSITWLAHFSYRNANNPPDDLPTEGTLYPGPYGRISTHFSDREPGFDQFRRTEAAIGYNLEQRFGDGLTLRQNTRYVHAILDQKLVEGVGLDPTLDDHRTLDRYALGAQAGANTFSLDNQAELRFRTGELRHTFLLGVDYLHSVDDYAEQDGDAPPIDVYAPVYGASISLGPVGYSVTHTIDQIGLYAQEQMRYGRWIGTFSGRRDWASTQTVDRLEDSQLRDSDNAYSWRAGMVYHFDLGLAPYVNAATSFTPAIGATYDGAPLSPTTGSSYETGIKYQPPGGRSLLTLSAFSLTENNVYSPDQQHLNFEIQNGKIRVRGAELSQIADFGHGLHLTTALSYMNGRQVANDNGTEGNAAANVPHWLASAWLDKTFQRGGLRGFGVSAGVRYVGPQFGDNDNQLQLPGYTLFDGALHYGSGHWYFALSGKNLLDRTYVGSCPAQDSCNYGLRRNINLRAVYGW